MLNIEKTTWSVMSKKIKKLNPAFYKAVEQVDGCDSLPLYIADYRYGDYILHDSMFHLPLKEGGTVRFDDKSIPKSVMRDLSYNQFSNPVMMGLEKGYEYFCEFEDTLIPMHILYPGEIFGLGHVLSGEKIKPYYQKASNSIGDITAGGRSMFITSRLTDGPSNKKLHTLFDLPIGTPMSYVEQWYFFRAMANQLECDWSLKLILFPIDWFKKIFDDNNFFPISNYFMRANRELRQFWSYSFEWELMLSRVRLKKNLSISSPAMVIVKHLLECATGKILSHAPDMTNTFMPVDEILNIYRENYRFWGIYPIMMSCYRYQGIQPSYVSLQYFTKLDVKSATGSYSAKRMLDDVSFSLERIVSAISEDNSFLDAPYLHEITEQVDFNFFHAQLDKNKPDIKDSLLLSAEKGFDGFRQGSGESFPSKSKFFRGVIQLKNKNH